MPLLLAGSNNPLRLCFCSGCFGLLDQLRESARILHGEVGENFAVDFDAAGLSVKLPASDKRRTVKVKISPTQWLNGK